VIGSSCVYSGSFESNREDGIWRHGGPHVAKAQTSAYAMTITGNLARLGLGTVSHVPVGVRYHNSGSCRTKPDDIHAAYTYVDTIGGSSSYLLLNDRPGKNLIGRYRVR
jgi:hypothetical protein